MSVLGGWRRWRRRHFPASTIVLLCLCLILVLFFVWPVIMLALGAFRTAPPGLPGEWSIAGFVEAYTDPATYDTLRNSVVLAVSVQVPVVLLGVFFAWIVARTNTPLRGLVTPMMVLVFAVPPLFFAISWGMLANEPAGMLNQVFRALTGIEASPFNAYSWYGLIGAEILKFTCAAYMLMLGPLLAMDRTLEEASLAAGGSRLRTFFQIDIPVLAPAITGLSVLGFVVSLGILDIPLLLGVPAGIDVFPTQILDFINDSTPPEYAQASALSLLFVLVVIVLVTAQRRLLGNRQFTTVTGKSYSTERWDIGKWRWVCTGAIVLYGLLALVLPLGQLVLGSLQPIFGLYTGLTLDHYRAALSDPVTFQALRNTILVGVLGGFIATTFAVVVSYVTRHSRSRMARLPQLAIWLLFAVPGVILGLAMVWAYLSTPVVRSLYATVWIVMIALVVYVTPVASRVTEGSVVQIGSELEEAARVAGASATRTMVAIVGRLIVPSFLAGWFITGILAAGNLDVPILLSAPSNQTIPLVVYELYDNGETAQAAAVFCLLLAVVALGLLVWVLVRLASRVALLGGRRPRRRVDKIPHPSGEADRPARHLSADRGLEGDPR